jgi:hypothetical protein
VARQDLLKQITNHLPEYGVGVVADTSLAKCLVDDPTGDRLDSLLCAIQAAWAWGQREKGFGAPHNLDVLEGWIADPKCSA